MGLALLSASAPFATDLYLPALPHIAEDLSSTPASVQLTLSGFMAGMAVGQLIIGPISDAVGRRLLLLAGAVVALVSSVMAAMAPGIGVLIGARLLQGVGAGACIVISRAVIPDLERGKKAAKAFALMMTIQGVAPVLAPVVGGLLAEPIGWRGLFWVLSAINAVQLVVALLLVPETKPKEERSSLRGLGQNYLFVLRNKAYCGFAVTFAFTFGAMFCYISASPFVVQEGMGFSATAFSVVFAVNALGLIGGNYLNSRLIDVMDTARILGIALIIMLVASVLLTGAAMISTSPWVILPLLFVAVSQCALIMGNATALGTGEVRERAGSGSAVMGFLQFGVAALVSPLMGLGSEGAVTMGAGMVISTLIALGAFGWARRHHVSLE
ncbi:multidrug effflux MFS transporter [Corynebacterium uropygiale]